MKLKEYKYNINWEITYSLDNSIENKILTGKDIYISKTLLTEEELTNTLHLMINSNLDTNSDLFNISRIDGMSIKVCRIKNYELEYNENHHNKNEKDKIYRKIQKLLNLSFNDNENEGKEALDKAIKLMNQHSISKEDIDKQEFIVLKKESEFIKSPEWEISLYNLLSDLSGCYLCWENGRSKHKELNLKERKAVFKIIGKERDVLNSSYLIAVINTQLKQLTEDFKEKKKLEKKKVSVVDLKSFKIGIIRGVYMRLKNSQNSFFEKKENKSLISLNTRRIEAKEFFVNKEQAIINDYKPKGKYSVSFNEGLEESDKIRLNKATENKNKDIFFIEK